MPSAEEAVVFPVKTRMGLLVLLALGRMVSISWAWAWSSGVKESKAAATTKAPNAKPLRFAGGGGTLYFHNIKKIVCSIVFENNLCVQKTILARICQLKNEKIVGFPLLCERRAFCALERRVAVLEL